MYTAQLKDQSLEQLQGCSFLTHFVHRKISQQADSAWADGLVPTNTLRLQACSEKTASIIWSILKAVLNKLCNKALKILALSAEHVEGKQGRSIRFLSLHWQCWCFLFTALQLISLACGYFAKSTTGCTKFLFEETLLKIEDTAHVVIYI